MWEMREKKSQKRLKFLKQGGLFIINRKEDGHSRAATSRRCSPLIDQAFVTLRWKWDIKTDLRF